MLNYRENGSPLCGQRFLFQGLFSGFHSSEIHFAFFFGKSPFMKRYKEMSLLSCELREVQIVFLPLRVLRERMDVLISSHRKNIKISFGFIIYCRSFFKIYVNFLHYLFHETNQFRWENKVDFT